MDDLFLKQSLNFSPNPKENDIDMTYKEFANQRDRFFPVRVHFASHYPHTNALIYRHWHEEMEILYLSKGKMEISIEEHAIFVEENDIIIIPSNALHASYNAHKVSCEFYAAVFDTNFISSFQHDLIQEKYIDKITMSQPKIHLISASYASYSDFFIPFFNLVDNFVNKPAGFELAVKANLLAFFSAFYRHIDHLPFYLIKNTANYSSGLFLCKKIILYIKENYSKKISLEDICEHMGFSKGYFCRFFKKHFKISFSAYVNQERIKNAIYFLTHSNQRIIDIAISTGFENVNYFASVFKKETGYSPSEYRKLKLRASLND